MFYQIFPSPQLKRCAFIPYKHGIYELSHELPNDLRYLVNHEILKIPGNQEIPGKCPNSTEWKPDSPVPYPHAKMKTLLILAKISWKTKINFAASHKLELVSNILWMIAGTKFQFKLTILKSREKGISHPNFKKWKSISNSTHSR